MSTLNPVPKQKSVEVSPPPPAVGPTQDVQALARDTARSARRARFVKMLVGLAIWVALPTLASAVYYGFIVPDQFESSTVVMLGGSETAASRNGVLLSEFLASRSALDALEHDVHYSEHFVGSGHQPPGSEARFERFLGNTSVRHDARSGIVRLRMRAYDGASAQRFAQVMVASAQRFFQHVDPGDARPFVVVAEPSRPDEPTYPRRGYSVLTAFLASLALYSIGSLLLAAMREHAHF